MFQSVLPLPYTVIFPRENIIQHTSNVILEYTFGFKKEIFTVSSKICTKACHFI